jgi:hypothetical protein
MNSYTKGSTQRLRAIFGTNSTIVRTAAVAGQLTLVLRSVTGLAVADVLMVEPGTDHEETATISAVSGTTLTLSAGLMYQHSIGAIVVELTDPTTVTLEVKDPAGTTTTYTYALAAVTKASTGVYYKDLAMSIVGQWHYRWTGTGTAPGVAEGCLNIESSHL